MNEDDHEPDCEALCTDGADCSCGAAALDPKYWRHKPRLSRPLVIPPEPAWRPSDRSEA